MNKLPPGWAEAPLGTIANVQLGRQRSPKNHHGPNMRPYLRAANVTWNGLALDDVKEMNFSAAEVTTFGLAPGDILLSEASGSASEVGKPAMWRSEIADYCFQNTLLRVRTRHLEPAYLLWFFKCLALSGQFARRSRGVGIHHLGAKALSEWSIPIAPKDEQKRIVAAIEEQFSRLDSGVAALMRARQNLKRLRIAVLQAALNGKLSPHPGEESSNHALLEDLSRTTQGSLTRASGLRRGWEWTTLGSICECLDSRRIPVNKKERLHRGGSVPYYGANGQVGWINDHLFDEPLVLVVEDETFTGREKPFSYKITGKSWVNNHAHVLRPKPGVDVDYLNYALTFYPFIPLTTGTTGRKKLTQRALLGAPLALPPEREQKAIATEVDHRISIIGHLEEQVDSSLIRASLARQSILNQAFSGKLVPQDRGDAPASALLERIAAEQAPSYGQRPARSRKPRTPQEQVRA
jgi:type I restriction enzyme S subunit